MKTTGRCARGRGEVEEADELVDRAGRAGAAEDDDVVVASVDRPVDDAARVLAQRRGLAAGRRGLRVRVRVQRQDTVADVVLDERQRAPGGRGVRVDEAARPERPVEHRVVADDRTADPLDQRAHLAGAPRANRCRRRGRPAGASERAGSGGLRARGAGRSAARAALEVSSARAAMTAKSCLMGRRYASGRGQFATWSHRRFSRRLGWPARRGSRNSRAGPTCSSARPSWGRSTVRCAPRRTGRAGSW